MWVRNFVWNFKGYLWYSAQNILTIHWKIKFLYNVENLRAPRYTNSYVSLKRSPCVLPATFLYAHFKNRRFTTWQCPSIHDVHSCMACLLAEAPLGDKSQLTVQQSYILCWELLPDRNPNPWVCGTGSWWVTLTLQYSQFVHSTLLNYSD